MLGKILTKINDKKRDKREFLEIQQEEWDKQKKLDEELLVDQVYGTIPYIPNRSPILVDASVLYDSSSITRIVQY